MNASNTLTVAIMILAAAFAGVSMTAQADTPTGVSVGEPSIKIDIDDLDLSSTHVAATVYNRIQFSARLVCSDSSSPWDVRRTSTFKRCFTAAVEDAVVRVNAPQLTALHQSKSKPVLVGAMTK